MNKNVIKIGGIVAVALGCVGLYLGGASESDTIALVGGVFTLAGIIAAMVKK